MQSESEASLSALQCFHARFDRRDDGSTYLIGEGGGCITAAITFYLPHSCMICTRVDTNGLVVRWRRTECASSDHQAIFVGAEFLMWRLKSFAEPFYAAELWRLLF
jgi:hypothetical protein